MAVVTTPSGAKVDSITGDLISPPPTQTPAVPDTVNSDNLKPQTPIPYNTPVPSPLYPVNTLNTEVPDLTLTQPEAQASDLTKSIMDLNKSLQGQSVFRSAQEEAQNLPEMLKTRTDLSGRLKSLQNEALAIPLQLQQNSEGRGITAAGLKPIETAALRNNAIQSLSVSAALEAANGNISLANDLVDRAVAQRFDPIKERIAVATANLDLILKSPEYSVADKNRAAKQKAAQDKLAKETATQEENAKAIYQTMIDAAKNGADALTLKKIQESKTKEQALKISTEAGFIVDPLARKKAQADIDYTISQTAENYAQAQKAIAEAKGGGTAGMDAAQLIAYANQYSTTGMIPTGLPKGTFGVVAQFAKEAGVQPGALVSRTTGVKDSKVPAAEQDDLTRLYNIVEMTKKLEALDKGRLGGITGGLINAVSGNQSAYLAQRKGIVDEIARMQTGAALTLQEQEFYKSYLPGAFSKALFIGASSQKQIDNFQSIMEEKLKNSLANKNLVIGGYSTVKLGGQDYHVGDIISVNGVQGRVLSDGSIVPLATQ